MAVDRCYHTWYVNPGLERPVYHQPSLRDCDHSRFSVSKSNLETVIAYIQNQREHHRDLTFKTEFLTLLERHEVDYDERYLWD